MADVRAEFIFSLPFPGTVWSLTAYPPRNVILIEVRDKVEKQVSFWALDYATGEFLWRNRKLEEPWWVNISGVYADVILFTLYLDSNNPDKKAVVAYSLLEFRLLWWNNDFSIGSIGDVVHGFTSKLGLKEMRLDILTGNVSGNADREKQKSDIQRPVQYAEGTDYFETIRIFLADRLNFSAVDSFEYLETDSHIFISCYEKQNELANYLIVLSLDGEIVLKEILDSPVQGIGLDTFFVIQRSLFFVKNKTDLVSYTLI
jgi:hypothetical protein